MEAELADGTILEFPEGTEPEVMQRAVRQYMDRPRAGAPDGSLGGIPVGAGLPEKPAPAPGAKPPLTFGQKFGQGVNSAIRQPVLAIGQLLGDENQQQVEDQRRRVKEAGLPGMLGGITTLAASPAGGAMNFAARQAAPALARAAGRLGAGERAAGTAGVVGANAAVAGATDPVLTPRGEGETVAGNAATAAGFGGGLSYGLSRAAQAVKGFKPNADALTLMADGVTPSLQHGTDSAIGRGIGHLSDFMASIIGQGGKGARRVERGGLELANARVTPPGMTPHALPKGDVDTRNMVQHLDDQYQTKYNEIFDGAHDAHDAHGTPDAKLFNEMGSKVAALKLPDRLRRQVEEEVVARLHPLFGKQQSLGEFNRGDYAAFRATANDLRSGNTVDDRRVGAALTEVGNSLKDWRNRALSTHLQNEGHPPDVVKQWMDDLAQTEHSWAEFRRLRGAVASQLNSKDLSARTLAQAVQQQAPTEVFGAGTGKLQDLSDLLVRNTDRAGYQSNSPLNWGLRSATTLGTGLASAPAGFGILGAGGLGAVVQSERGTKALLGQYQVQKNLSKMFDYGARHGATLYQGGRD